MGAKQSNRADTKDHRPQQARREVKSYSRTKAVRAEMEGPDSEPHRIRLLCWNLDGLDRRSIEDRMHAVCDTINKEKPHVVFLQEVIPLTLPILSEGCGMYQVIPGGDNHYFTAIMLRVGHVQFEESSVTPFPTSMMLRNLLSVKCRVKGIRFQMMTSHLESPVGASNYNDERKSQQVKAFEAMKEADHDRTVLFGGDTNMIDEEVGTLPEDIFDLWETTGQRADAKYTYDKRTNDNRAIPGYKQFMRLDRLYIRHSTPMSQVTQVDFELAGTDRLPCNRFPSDHWGIQAHFNINGVPKPT
ncbi:tyrosyl-DNA phosphodiesterase 2-like isoform X3 [Haliotis rufescens]|uniref:tyrosyl-DNA phosphodiesterase 2-like isoform X3 n=1 Tax=Haliotis rufescens TaxID=6454 RepID=UPI00201EAF64|nr:tyrosyl-DNA phosphodiesterase 2-like isoform X3 [Haliotis rufescens]XP_048249348.1 tyrosyl-DNA phosphodiesterase 2-like isoform X3 [Haliotis rufescens]